MGAKAFIRRRRSWAGGLLLVGAVAAAEACARRGASSREVWAEVDGQAIFRDQVERIFRSRTTPGTDVEDAEQALSFKLSILNELINNQILVAHASRSHITVSEAEIDTKIAELESPYSREEFEKKLKNQGMDLSELRRQVRESLIINKLVNKEISSKISVTGAEIAAYYERNKATFNVPETRYHLAQILVTPEGDAELRNLKNDDAKSGPAAERKVQALAARVRAGEDFATVAQDYSEDPRTAAGGGDMGFLPASSLNSELQLKAAVTSLKVGEVSGIIRTRHGFHIVKLLGKEEGGQRLPNDPRVQSAVRQALFNGKEQLLKAAYIELLRNRAKVLNHLADKIVSGPPGNP